MYTYSLHQHINDCVRENVSDIAGVDNGFYLRFLANATAIESLFNELYGHHPERNAYFDELLATIIAAYKERSPMLKAKDLAKEAQGHWFLSNEIAGMSLYVDRFCGSLAQLPEKLSYFETLGVNLLHLMPIFESPEGESDGGYAVSNFRKVDRRFGNNNDLLDVSQALHEKDMYLMLDIVLNHTSHRHEWAEKAKAGDQRYQDYFYMYPDRNLPDHFDRTMPEIFPESAPGSFTYNEETGKWVMTVFHQYQWDLNYRNPEVFVRMLDTLFYYANLGVDLLRIDAPAFIWKELGTTCQNLPKAHTLLRLIKQCVQVATPGMALLGEAIVSPKEIMKYFGTDAFTARECDFAYNATHMALQWDALATGDTKVMLAAQHEILQKPYGSSWITYTRCHDDIGLGYDDAMIAAAGFNSYEHRRYLKDYFSGARTDSPAVGALFSVNPKTNDARISGSLASLCGLEKALQQNNQGFIDESVQKILMMQAHSFFLGGVPMIFYGDEMGYTNDYRYLQDPGKSYDNRWMHRPIIDWDKNARSKQEGSLEHRIFTGTQKLLDIRKALPVIADHKNLVWLSPHNEHVAGYLRSSATQQFFGVFNFSNSASYLTWYAFKEKGFKPSKLHDHWRGVTLDVGPDHEYLIMAPYSFYLLEVTE